MMDMTAKETVRFWVRLNQSRESALWKTTSWLRMLLGVSLSSSCMACLRVAEGQARRLSMLVTPLSLSSG